MSAWRRWVALLDTREPPESLAAVRIVVGATVLLTLARAWWSGAAAAVWVASDRGGAGASEPGLLEFAGGLGWTQVRALLVVGLVASTFVIAGRFTRVASFVAWLSFRTLAFSNPASGASGDDILSHLLVLLMLSGAGRAWSLGARPDAIVVPAWPRYVAIGQLVAIYVSAGWQKTSASWMPHGSLDAVWYALQNPMWARWSVPTGALAGRVAQAATLATWLFEMSSPLLLLAFYFRATADRPGRVRRWFNRHDVRAKYLAIGLCVHVGIELTMEVGTFFGGMMALYAACIHPTEWRRARTWATR